MFVSNKPYPAHRPLFWITTPLPIKYLLPLIRRSGREGKYKKPGPEGDWTLLYTEKQLSVPKQKVEQYLRTVNANKQAGFEEERRALGIDKPALNFAPDATLWI